MEAELDMTMKTHICNCCGSKGETYAMHSEDGHYFNICPCCGVRVLSEAFFKKMSLAQISDILRKQV